MSDPLANVVWHALTGPAHAGLAVVQGAARRYPLDVSVFGAVDAFSAAAWDGLAALAALGDGTVALFRETVEEAPPGWTPLLSMLGHQLVLEAIPSAGLPPEPDGLVPLGLADAAEMLALVAVTRPGPFALRTPVLGRYVGVRDADGRLVAMAGERFRLPGWTEISAVCTRPEARGRGLAAALTAEVARAALARGERALLHVAEGNDAALRVYDRLGFTWRRMVQYVQLGSPP